MTNITRMIDNLLDIASERQSDPSNVHLKKAEREAISDIESAYNTMVQGLKDIEYYANNSYAKQILVKIGEA